MSAFYFFISSGRWAHFQAAAKEYAVKHNGENYFTALNQVSCLCHLKAEEFFHCCLVINKSKPKFISWVYSLLWKLSTSTVFGRDDNLYPD